MSTHHPPRRRRIAVVTIAALLITGGVLAAATTGASGQTSISVESLTASNQEATIDGDVSDVGITADLRYDHEVPNADGRVIELHVGPSESELSQVTFVSEADPQDAATGTVTLEGSLLEAGFTAGQFDPPAAGTTTTEVVVQAVIEVDRANGETVTRTATDTATITIHDDGTITAAVGGEVSFDVQIE